MYDDRMSEENEKNLAIPVRVLLVDNDKDHAKAMHESLERIGLECSYATSGPEGARMLDENTYEVVVTDLMMNDTEKSQRHPTRLRSYLGNWACDGLTGGRGDA